MAAVGSLAAALLGGKVLEGVAYQVGQRPAILLGDLLQLIAQWRRDANCESWCIHEGTVSDTAVASLRTDLSIPTSGDLGLTLPKTVLT
jgi:hypothetical protein